jgi:hypothetical protein
MSTLSNAFNPFHPITHDICQSKSVVQHPNTRSIVFVAAGIGEPGNDSHRGTAKQLYWRGRHVTPNTVRSHLPRAHYKT